MSLLVFEDSVVPQLAPITTARPACCITVGSYHLLDLLRTTGNSISVFTRKYLREICALDLHDIDVFGGNQTADNRSEGQPTLLLNARLIPCVSTLKGIEALIADANATGVVWSGEQIAAIVRPGWSWGDIDTQLETGIGGLLKQAETLPKIDTNLPLASYPHEIIQANMDLIGENLSFRIEQGGFEQQADGVFVSKGVKLGEYLITDTSGGPIVIDEDASVGPYTLLKGPIYIGRKCRILEHAAIKDQVSLGHTTKIGGEVEAAIVEPFSNKQHHGFLGHSYLGSWINLGAGTCNSDLKNTYGTVNMEYPSGKAATGMQFLGCVVGDYSKTAINTGIFTGKVIGVCSMMYGFVTSNVPSYVNYARLFGQIATLPPEVMIATQQRMFSRRNVQQRPCDVQLLHDMYRLTQGERDRVGDDIAF